MNSNLWFKYQIILTALCHPKPRNRRKTGLAPGNWRLHKNSSYFPPWEKETGVDWKMTPRAITRTENSISPKRITDSGSEASNNLIYIHQVSGNNHAHHVAISAALSKLQLLIASSTKHASAYRERGSFSRSFSAWRGGVRLLPGDNYIVSFCRSFLISFDYQVLSQNHAQSLHQK